jgi:hypothetical protein
VLGLIRRSIFHFLSSSIIGDKYACDALSSVGARSCTRFRQ